MEQENRFRERTILLRKIFDGLIVIKLGKELHEPYCGQFNENGYDANYKYYNEEDALRRVAETISDQQLLDFARINHDKLKTYRDFHGQFYTYHASRKELLIENSWPEFEQKLESIKAKHGRAVFAVLQAYKELKEDWNFWSVCDYNRLAYRAKELSGKGWKNGLIALEVAGIMNKRGSGRRPGERSIPMELMPLIDLVLNRWKNEEGPLVETTEPRKGSKTKSSKWDVFISHASADKELVATPLAQKLIDIGLSVWYDDFTLKWGDSLMHSIDTGLKNSLFGIVILSKAFFEKEWTKKELGGLMSLANRSGEKKILPLRYKLTAEQVAEFSPILSDILSRSWDDGLEILCDEIKKIVAEKKAKLISNQQNKKRMVKQSVVKNTLNSQELDFTLDKFTENGIHHIGIRNAGGKTIQAIMVFCNEQRCAWWDTGDFLPRHLYAGGGWNVHLPRGFANTDPMITVKSNDRILAQTTLSKIVHRPSEKWTAKDEDAEYVDRLNMTLGRIRSNLGTLQSLFEAFSGYPNNMPVTEEVERDIAQKNELVDSAQLTVTQASHVLEMDWIQRINDLCALAKKHPYSIGERGKFLRCEHCVGIISQIDSLLKDLPNSPI